MSAERTPRETLEALRRMTAEDDAREEDELDRIEAMSDAQVATELELDGIDPKAADARAEEIHRRLHPTNGARVASLPTRRRATRLVWLAAAAVAVATAAYAARTPIVRLFSHEEQVPPENPTPTAIASGLCDRAVDACRAKKWDACKALLDQAADVHPDIRLDDRYVRATWAVDQAQTVDSNLPWFDKTIGPGLRPRPGTDKPTAPR